MTNDRIAVSAGTVAALIASQFPQWAHLVVTPVAQGGWDNHTFHLGHDMKVRLPSAERYVAQVHKENRVLPLLAPHLPLPVPVPLAIGAPGPGFDWPWSVYSWMEGETLAPNRITDPIELAQDLAGFLLALQAIETANGPAAGVQNFHRGGDLSVYDAETRRSIATMGSSIDASKAHALWDKALASRWQDAPVWVHGDIAVGNLLVKNGRLGAVIDFGGCCIGDPACDLVIAYTYLGAEARAAFKDCLPYDDQTWSRARGWALWKALLMAERDQALHPSERPALDQVALLLGS